MLVCFCGLLKAQDEQIYKPLLFQVEDGKETVSYVMDSYSYVINRYYTDTITGDKTPVLQLNATIQAKPDKMLLEWITLPKAERRIKVVCRDIKTGETYRTYTMEGTFIVSWSESLSEYYLRDTGKSSLYLEMVCKEFSIDNYLIKDLKSPYEDY